MIENPNVTYYNKISEAGRPILDLLEIEYLDSCIKTQKSLSVNGGLNFCAITGIKYLWRLGIKTKSISADLVKAIDYFTWAAKDSESPLYEKMKLVIEKCQQLLEENERNIMNQSESDRRIKIVKLSELGQTPEYAHIGDSGADLKAIEFTEVPAGGWRKISTGLAIELPHGMEAQIRSRSGLAARHGICVLNSPGTIDASYTGEICVLLVNHSFTDFRVNIGDKIAQLVICPVSNNVRFDSVERIAKSTSRGSEGFGSTGIFAGDINY
jgi:dUTP pyrophosphatase